MLAWDMKLTYDDLRFLGALGRGGILSGGEGGR
jgi:hypothetical protein